VGSVVVLVQRVGIIVYKVIAVFVVWSKVRVVVVDSAVYDCNVDPAPQVLARRMNQVSLNVIDAP
jgi:hypothetical protein